MKTLKKDDIKKYIPKIEKEEEKEEEKEAIQTSSIMIDIQNDMNIIKIHRKIIRYFDGIKAEIEQLEKEMSKLDYGESIVLLQKINMKKKCYAEKEEYLRDTKDIISAYPSLVTDEDKREMMLKFIEISRNYHDISYKNEYIIVKKCKICGEPEPTEHCLICGEINGDYQPFELIERNDRKKDFEKMKEFEKTIEEYEGSQELTDDEIKYLDGIVKDDLDKTRILKILSKNKQTKLKKKINAIMHHYYGTPLVSLDGKRNLIKEKFSLILPVYNSIKPENRTNSLKRLLVLHCLLLTEGFKPEGGEDILKTKESLTEQLTILKDIFMILSITHPEYNWNFDF